MEKSQNIGTKSAFTPIKNWSVFSLNIDLKFYLNKKGVNALLVPIF